MKLTDPIDVKWYVHTSLKVLVVLGAVIFPMWHELQQVSLGKQKLSMSLAWQEELTLKGPSYRRRDPLKLDASLPNILLAWDRYARFYAWDKKTGQLLWESDFKPKSSFRLDNFKVITSPSTNQLLILTGYPNTLLSVDPQDGNIRWMHRLPDYRNSEPAIWTDEKDICVAFALQEGAETYQKTYLLDVRTGKERSSYYQDEAGAIARYDSSEQTKYAWQDTFRFLPNKNYRFLGKVIISESEKTYYLAQPSTIWLATKDRVLRLRAGEGSEHNFYDKLGLTIMDRSGQELDRYIVQNDYAVEKWDMTVSLNGAYLLINKPLKSIIQRGSIAYMYDIQNAYSIHKASLDNGESYSFHQQNMAYVAKRGKGIFIQEKNGLQKYDEDLFDRINVRQLTMDSGFVYMITEYREELYAMALPLTN